MSNKLAVVDATYLCHLTMHTPLGRLRDGIIFGFLGCMETLADRFGDHDYIYCFDSPENLRKKIYPAYKGNRKPKPEDEAIEFNRQRNIIQHELLPELGCAVYCQRGYEADDCIGKVVKDGTRWWGHRAFTIVSGDEDMYQLLAPNVRQWQPARSGRMVTYKAWCEKSGISPKQWIMVKAIAGCSSDNIQGVENIGPARAVDYLLGTLNLKYVHAIAACTEIIQRNVGLVKLPLDGMPDLPDIDLSGVPDSITWNAVSRKYGMPSRARGIRSK